MFPLQSQPQSDNDLINSWTPALRPTCRVALGMQIVVQLSRSGKRHWHVGDGRGRDGPWCQGTHRPPWGSSPIGGRGWSITLISFLAAPCRGLLTFDIDRMEISFSPSVPRPCHFRAGKSFPTWHILCTACKTQDDAGPARP